MTHEQVDERVRRPAAPTAIAPTAAAATITIAASNQHGKPANIADSGTMAGILQKLVQLEDRVGALESDNQEFKSRMEDVEDENERLRSHIEVLEESLASKKEDSVGLATFDEEGSSHETERSEKRQADEDATLMEEPVTKRQNQNLGTSGAAPEKTDEEEEEEDVPLAPPPNGGNQLRLLDQDSDTDDDDDDIIEEEEERTPMHQGGRKGSMVLQQQQQQQQQQQPPQLEEEEGADDDEEKEAEFPLESTVEEQGVLEEHPRYFRYCSQFLHNISCGHYRGEFPRQRAVLYIRNLVAYLCLRHLSGEGQHFIVPDRTCHLSSLSADVKKKLLLFMKDQLKLRQFRSKKDFNRLYNEVIYEAKPQAWWKYKGDNMKQREYEFYRDVLNIRARPTRKNKNQLML